MEIGVDGRAASGAREKNHCSARGGEARLLGLPVGKEEGV